MDSDTYKRVGDVSISVDLAIPPAGASAIVVWIHGGALINGDRDSVPGWLSDACAESDFALASIDYRLAPETKLPNIVGDVEDAFRWLRRVAPARFPVAAERIAVVGESAGGYLALTTGFRVQPRPEAVVSLYGYGDLIGAWYSRPSTHPCHQGTDLTPSEIARMMSGPPVSGGGSATATARRSTSTAGGTGRGPPPCRAGIRIERPSGSAPSCRSRT